LLAALVLGFIALAGIYLLPFLVIRFVIFLYCKLKNGGHSDASEMTLAAHNVPAVRLSRVYSFYR
jgi:hypothetical protein